MHPTHIREVLFHYGYLIDGYSVWNIHVHVHVRYAVSTTGTVHVHAHCTCTLCTLYIGSTEVHVALLR